MMRMRDYRCAGCEKLLFRANMDLPFGLHIEIACSRCKYMNDITRIGGPELVPDGQGGFIKRDVV